MQFVKPSVFVSILLITASAVAAVAKPEPVPQMTQRKLEGADYAELARQWKEYIDENGENAEALVNLGMAYEYSGSEDAALKLARRAVELAPDNPRALTLLGKLLAVWADDEDAALVYLQRSRKIAPDYQPCLGSLAATFLRRGDTKQADEVFAAMFQYGTIDHPLQDFAYNLLVGLPEGAVLVTSGDNDTFAVLALQAGRKFRRDVIVVNRSLLNLPEYVVGVFAQQPGLQPGVDVENYEAKWVGTRAMTLSAVLIDALVSEAKTPIYIAPTAAYEQHGYEPTGEIEGMNLRASGEAMSDKASAALFFSKYRLDSATDWNFAWSLSPSLRALMRNYVSAMYKNAQRKSLPKELRQSLLDRAAEIAEFHNMRGVLASIEAARAR